ncbi:rhamnan synthesis F family protein [Acetobacter conturbans]|uniref:Glycosyl transferase n=1 Tax=Acetobacter conturbans TaxID=1737472 RepID=A0ABX0JZL1_9PROT|nr:rhamnan synthesis F family protein [Acetobacter conturbans]NHN87898.1 glycosyl transferase [Acetobacter conturbans]
MPDSVCLFAAYTPKGELAPHTVYYLSELIQCGFTIHLALSGCDDIANSTLDFCTINKIIPWTRPNIGHDFGAWKDLILHGYAEKASRILLANDSVFGPFTSLKPLFNRMANRDADVWGLLESLSVTPHLQSWFVCFEHSSFQTPAIQRTLLQEFDHMSREELIWHGELGLSIACRAEGLTTQAIWSDRHHPVNRVFKTNAMHSNWQRMLRTGAIPFIKTELLRDNPFGLSSATHWKENLPASSGFNPEWIVEYLQTQPQRPQKTRSNWKGRLLYKLVEGITDKS